MVEWNEVTGILEIERKSPTHKVARLFLNVNEKPDASGEEKNQHPVYATNKLNERRLIGQGRLAIQTSLLTELPHRR